MSSECPRCLAIKRAFTDKMPGWCSRCQRWQLLGALEWKDFSDSKHQHLACLACKKGAWCRDFWMRPEAYKCGREGHVEPFELHAKPRPDGDDVIG